MTKFSDACFDGNIDIVKSLLNSTDLDIHADNEDAFRWACK